MGETKKEPFIVETTGKHKGKGSYFTSVTHKSKWKTDKPEADGAGAHFTPHLTHWRPRTNQLC